DTLQYSSVETAAISPYAAQPTSSIHPLPLHDALPICAAAEQAVHRVQFLHLRQARCRVLYPGVGQGAAVRAERWRQRRLAGNPRSEEHTSELQSRENLVCRLLLEKKKKTEEIRKGRER